MRKISDRELKQLIKENGFYKTEEMYWMGFIKLSSKQIDYLLEEKRKTKIKESKEN